MTKFTFEHIKALRELLRTKSDTELKRMYGCLVLNHSRHINNRDLENAERIYSEAFGGARPYDYGTSARPYDYGTTQIRNLPIIATIVIFVLAIIGAAGYFAWQKWGRAFRRLTLAESEFLGKVKNDDAWKEHAISSAKFLSFLDFIEIYALETIRDMKQSDERANQNADEPRKPDPQQKKAVRWFSWPAKSSGSPAKPAEPGGPKLVETHKKLGLAISLPGAEYLAAVLTIRRALRNGSADILGKINDCIDDTIDLENQFVISWVDETFQSRAAYSQGLNELKNQIPQGVRRIVLREDRPDINPTYIKKIVRQSSGQMTVFITENIRTIAATRDAEGVLPRVRTWFNSIHDILTRMKNSITHATGIPAHDKIFILFGLSRCAARAVLEISARQEDLSGAP